MRGRLSGVMVRLEGFIAGALKKGFLKPNSYITSYTDESPAFVVVVGVALNDFGGSDACL
jgi:hypothetical protein